MFGCCSLKTREARKFSVQGDFRELTESYEFTNDEEVFRDGEWQDAGWKDFVSMNAARQCSFYRCHDNGIEEKIPIGERLESARDLKEIDDDSDAKFRGITIRQLRAVWANASRRCVVEKWKDYDGKLLTPSTLNLYHVNRFIIKPFTYKKRNSFIEEMPSTVLPQTPRWFVNHWWGQTMQDFMACIEQHMKDFEENDNQLKEDSGGGMSEDSPIWISAFAVNQWGREESGVQALPDTNDVFTQAMLLSKGRILSIIDREGCASRRICFVYELHKALLQLEGSIAVYTAIAHKWVDPYNGDTENRKAVGILEQGTPSDIGDAVVTASREKHFPFHLIETLLKMKIEVGRSTVQADRDNILRAIVGNENVKPNDDPPKFNIRYTFMNRALRSSLATSFGILQAAKRQGEREWKMALSIMSKGKTECPGVEFDFEEGNGWDGMSAEEAKELVLHLPVTVERIILHHVPFGSTFVDALIDWITTTTKLKAISISHMFIGSIDEARRIGARLAQILKSSTTIEEISLRYTDLIGVRNATEWADMLQWTKTVRTFQSIGMGAYSGKVDASSLDDEALFEYPHDDRQVVYYENGIFPGAMLTDKGLKILAEGIAANPSQHGLESMDLRYHQIGTDGIAALSPVVKKKKTMKNLNIFEDDEERKQEVNNALLSLESETVEFGLDVEIKNSWE